jgi:hypothetical protein
MSKPRSTTQDAPKARATVTPLASFAARRSKRSDLTYPPSTNRNPDTPRLF